VVATGADADVAVLGAAVFVVARLAIISSYLIKKKNGRE
jgi:uncharacterized MAPEG superfamily protein